MIRSTSVICVKLECQYSWDQTSCSAETIIIKENIDGIPYCSTFKKKR